MLAAALAGLQAKGLALTKVPTLKFLIIISGARLLNESWAEKAFSNAICCPSLHFLGETDFLKPYGTVLLESFVDPVVIHHGEGHTIPRLDEKGSELVLSFLEKIQKEGSVLSAALVGLQAKGLALTKVPKLKFLIIISGAKLRNEAWVDKAFSDIIRCPSLHFLGELDYLKSQGTELLESFVDPVVIHHREGHTVPSLDEKGLKLMLSFLLKMQNESWMQRSDATIIALETPGTHYFISAEPGHCTNGMKFATDDSVEGETVTTTPSCKL
uniref:Serine hydrolase FSH domain-containing protein n=1 Tax=Daucus carota subsp. sativus TaxID=79200 RepID=A0A165Z971_DAUCS